MFTENKKQLSTEWKKKKSVRDYNKIKSLLEEINKEKTSMKKKNNILTPQNNIVSQNKMMKVPDFISQGIGKEIITEIADKKGLKKQKKTYKLIDNKKFDKNLYRVITTNKDKIIISTKNKNVSFIKPKKNNKNKIVISNFKKLFNYEK